MSPRRKIVNVKFQFICVAYLICPPVAVYKLSLSLLLQIDENYHIINVFDEKLLYFGQESKIMSPRRKIVNVKFQFICVAYLICPPVSVYKLSLSLLLQIDENYHIINVFDEKLLYFGQESKIMSPRRKIVNVKFQFICGAYLICPPVSVYKLSLSLLLQIDENYHIITVFDKKLLYFGQESKIMSPRRKIGNVKFQFICVAYLICPPV